MIEFQNEEQESFASIKVVGCGGGGNKSEAPAESAAERML